MKKLIIIAAVGLSILTAAPLSLADAEALALENNLQIKLSRESYKKAKSEKIESISGFLPQVSSYYQLQDNLELQVMVIDFDGDGPQPPQELKMGSTYNATAGLSLSYPVFTGGAVRSGRKMSSEAMTASKLNLQNQVNSVINTVRTLYYQIQMLESMKDATQKGMESAKENYELALQKQTVGKATKLEILQAQVSYESYKPQLISLNNQLSTAKNNLIIYINSDQNKSMEIEGKLKMIDNPYKGMELDDVVDLARRQRIELKLAAVQKKIAKYQKNLAVSAVMPKVQLSSAVNWTSNSDALDNMNYIRSSNVGVSVSLPLFNGGKNALSIQQSKIGMKEADLQYEQTQDFILAEVKTAYNKVRESYMNIEANENVVNQAEEALRLSKLMYDAGSATQLDVMSAESGYFGALSNYISSVFQYNIAVETLKKSLNHIHFEGVE